MRPDCHEDRLVGNLELEVQEVEEEMRPQGSCGSPCALVVVGVVQTRLTLQVAQHCCRMLCQVELLERGLGGLEDW